MDIQQTYKINNFDLLRLFAALQVVGFHTIEVLHIHPPEVIRSLLKFSFMFPGVPIFFFLSGFLISKSYESNHKLSEYFQNRILRLYPALIVCVSLSFLLIYISDYMGATSANVFDWSLLYLAKTSVLQFYNPEFMRGYGDGVLNGSLWTITVELQFYLLVPIVYAVFNLESTRFCNLKLIALILLFLLINRLYTYIPDANHGDVAYKLLRVSFFPWFYMFLIGVFVQKNFEAIYKFVAGKFIYFFIIYCVIGYSALTYNIELGNNINPLVYMFLVVLIMSFAYSAVGLSRKILRGNDISYGTYIYHMPIINFMLYNGYSGEFLYAVVVFFLTVIVALTSWLIVEKKSLKLKKHPLNPLNNLK